LLADDFLKWTPNIINNTNDTSVENGIFQQCDLTSNDTNEGYIYTCSEFQDPWFGIATLVFIYLPGPQVLSALFGPKMGGWMAEIWGLFVMLPIGLVIALVAAPYYNSAELFVFGWFLVCLGGSTSIIGWKIFNSSGVIIRIKVFSGYFV